MVFTWVYISAGVPRIKIADWKETRMEMATGIRDMLRPPIRYSPGPVRERGESWGGIDRREEGEKERERDEERQIEGLDREGQNERKT